MIFLTKIKKIFIFLLFLNSLTLFSKDIQLPYKLQPESNIFIKIFLFYFPLSNNYETNFFYDSETYSIEITIKKNHIINEPSTPILFETDLFFRIDKIPYNKFGNLDLLLTIRVNKRIISFIVPFKINQKKRFIYLKGKLMDLKFKDITNDSYFFKRKDVKIPLMFDLIIGSYF